jgi:hypothetical protein
MNNKIIDLQWVENFTDNVAQESIKLLKAYGSSKANKHKVDLLKQFLVSYVKLIVYHAVAKLPDTILSEKDSFKFARENYKSIKIDIQDAVADGFQQAIVPFANADVDYYCNISTVGDPINTKIC